MKFTVDKDIFEKLPNICFGVVVANEVNNKKRYPVIEQMLNNSIETASQLFSGKVVKEEPLILPYREAFRTLGINPNKYMCSIESLITRIAKGKGMPHINPIVDLGNAISLKYILPIGAHDLKNVEEGISVRLACTGDSFLPFGSNVEEIPEVGEAIYAVGSQVRTRRWTWRQSEHGKILTDTSFVFFPIDGFCDINQERVLTARDELQKTLYDVFGCKTVSGFIDAEHPEMYFAL